MLIKKKLENGCHSCLGHDRRTVFYLFINLEELHWLQIHQDEQRN